MYLPTTAMHEFGHAAGLYDLYELDREFDESRYDDYVMGDQYNELAVPDIPDLDRDYLQDVYRGHTRHSVSSE